MAKTLEAVRGGIASWFKPSAAARRLENAMKHKFTITLSAVDMPAAAAAAEQMAEGFRKGYVPSSGIDPITGFKYETRKD